MVELLYRFVMVTRWFQGLEGLEERLHSVI